MNSFEIKQLRRDGHTCYALRSTLPKVGAQECETQNFENGTQLKTEKNFVPCAPAKNNFSKNKIKFKDIFTLFFKFIWFIHIRLGVVLLKFIYWLLMKKLKKLIWLRKCSFGRYLWDVVKRNSVGSLSTVSE